MDDPTAAEADLDRQAVLDELAEDIELGALSDREWVLVEMIVKLGGDPSPETWQLAPADQLEAEDLIDATQRIPGAGVAVGQ